MQQIRRLAPRGPARRSSRCSTTPSRQSASSTCTTAHRVSSSSRVTSTSTGSDGQPCPPCHAHTPASGTLSVCTTHRRQVKDPAHNPRARAPEHLQLVNNLISSNHSEHADETHLPVDTPTWNKLATHMREIAVTPCRVCFQCGMENHPQPGDTIRVYADDDAATIIKSASHFV